MKYCWCTAEMQIICSVLLCAGCKRGGPCRFGKSKYRCSGHLLNNPVSLSTFHCVALQRWNKRMVEMFVQFCLFEFFRNLPTHATQILMRWKWSLWVFFAPGASLISEKVQQDQVQKDHVVNYRRQIMTNRALFCSVFQEFVRYTNKDIEQIIKKEMSGDVKNAFYAIGNSQLWHQTLTQCYTIFCVTVCLCFAVRSVKNQPSYFADRLYKAMKVFVAL